MNKVGSKSSEQELVILLIGIIEMMGVMMFLDLQLTKMGLLSLI
jgi:hypothetical protein